MNNRGFSLKCEVVQLISAMDTASKLGYNSNSDGLIRESPWSTTYREKDFLIKKYRYRVISAIQREANASDAAKSIGINTPLFYETRESELGICNIFEYVPMRSMDEKELLVSHHFQKQTGFLLDSLARVPWDNADDYWRASLMPEFEFALSFLGIDTSRYLDFLVDLVPAVFIHGDFTCQNFGVTATEDIVLFDFQHGSLGPQGWDKSYLASTFFPNSFFFPLSQEERMMAETIAAIRLGRGIKKRIKDLGVREELFQLWHNSNR